jgi:hypothetical protein
MRAFREGASKITSEGGYALDERVGSGFYVFQHYK